MAVSLPPKPPQSPVSRRSRSSSPRARSGAPAVPAAESVAGPASELIGEDFDRSQDRPYAPGHGSRPQPDMPPDAAVMRAFAARHASVAQALAKLGGPAKPPAPKLALRAFIDDDAT